jgi:glutaredoxin
MEKAAMLSARKAAWFAVLVACSLGAQAQPVYRIVGPDGRVTFTDRPPADASAKAVTAPVVTMGADNDVASLPFELRSAASRFPVTLYSRPGCVPCDTGRNYLTSRGIPFTEKTVTTNEDIDALQRLAGTPTLPFATIGGQQLKGYSEVEWSQFLDAAGYPKVSVLPSNFRRPAPTPLVAAATPPQQPAVVPEQQARPGTQGRPAPSQSNSNPAGIQF